MSEYIVMTSSAHVAGKARRFGRYRNVAVCEVEDGCIPKQISNRAKGMIRIVQHFGSFSVGKTSKCAYARMVAAAEQHIADLNSQRAQTQERQSQC